MAQTLPEPIALGRLAVHPVTMPDAVEHIMAMVALGEGGYIVTPNVDHVCLAERDDDKRYGGRVGGMDGSALPGKRGICGGGRASACGY